MKRLLGYLRPYRAEFALGLFCMVLFGASDGAIPFLVKYILDGVFADQNKDLLTLLPVLIVIFAVIRGVFGFGQEFLMSRIGHKIVRDLRSELNKHILSLHPGFFVEVGSAGLVSRVSNDTLQAKALLTESVASVIRDTIRIIGLICAAVYLDPMLALIGLVAFPLGVYPIIRIGKRMRALGRRGQESVGAISSLLQSTIIGGKVVRVFGREPYEEKRFNDENSKLFRTMVKGDTAKALTTPINEFLGAIAISAVLLYGGLTVINGTRTQGDFIAFLLSLFLLYDPFKRLSKVHASMQQAMGALDRIFDLLDTKPEIVDAPVTRDFPESTDIKFDKVSFKYPTGETFALNDVSFDIPKGSTTALVGFSGSGKSTSVDLIPRFLDPTQGRVLIGGVNVRDLKLSVLRSKIAMVSQHTFLFNDSVFENIRYGDLNASKEQIEEAARSAYAHDFITALPDGYNTMVGEGGFALSGGERQRIAIARAILKNAPILILDEATASLDNRSEREVQDALSKLMVGKTSIVIAHRLSTVLNADKIFVFEDGKIVESGTHESLLANSGLYFRLYNEGKTAGV